MKLPTPSDLSAAVEAAAKEDRVTTRRMRRWLAVNEVFNIARSRGIFPRFIVKGGFALELRFRSQARASRDVDIVVALNRDEVMDAAIEAMRLAWSGFTFGIKGKPDAREHSFRFELNSFYQGRDWSTFELELVFDEVYAEDSVAALDLSRFSLSQPFQHSLHDVERTDCAKTPRRVRCR